MILSQMISSMTGYAAASADTGRGTLGIELRSVNGRFLDLSLRVAEELRALEPMLRETISARLARGKVDCRVFFLESPDHARLGGRAGGTAHRLGAFYAATVGGRSVDFG